MRIASWTTAWVGAVLCAACTASIEPAEGDGPTNGSTHAALAPAPAAAPTILGFSVEPSRVDVGVRTALTFRFQLAPLSGPPPRCRISPHVGVAASPITRRVRLDQSTTFTLSCRAALGGPGEATATATVLALPQVSGPEPSERAVAFYYPWYGTPEVDGQWVHWDAPTELPPRDLTSPYYPVLGAHSVNDPEVAAQHFAWLRRAGVGVVALSFWGPGSFPDAAIAGLLDMAQRYRVKVAFHIEPYEGRSAATLAEHVAYLYERYGAHPAFHRSTATTRHSPGGNGKGLFFLWAPVVDRIGGAEVDAAYWRDAVDAIHASAEGGLVIAHILQPSWIDSGHFDGLYNYAAVNPDPTHAFDWAMGIPPGAMYIPSVLPGTEHWAGPTPYVPRREGAAYAEQWQAALGVGVEPELVSITSFNEWHEGTQIEPALAGATRSDGEPYLDYSPLDPYAYLDFTRDEIAGFLAYEWPQTHAARIRVETTSDFAVVGIDAGAAWLRPELIDVSPGVTAATMNDARFALAQPVDSALAGQRVEMTHDLFFQRVTTEPGARVRFSIARGHVGAATVTIWSTLSGAPIEVARFTWDGIAPDPGNTGYFEVPAELLVAAP